MTSVQHSGEFALCCVRVGCNPAQHTARGAGGSSNRRFERRFCPLLPPGAKVGRAGARNIPHNNVKTADKTRRGTLAPPYKGGAVMRNACGARGAFSRAVGDAGPYRVQRGQTVRGRAAAWGHAALRKCIQSGRRGTLAPPYEAVRHKGCILVRRIQQKARSTAAGLLVVFTYL